MFDKFKIWIPLLGIYYLAIDDKIVQSRKIAYLFIHLFLGLIFIVATKEPTPERVKVAKDEPKEVVEEKKAEPETDNKDLAKKVQKLANGNGKNWNMATDTEKVAFCLYSIQTLEKKEDISLAIKLCKEMNVFYGSNDMVNQPVIETSTVLYSLIKKGI